MNLSEIRQLFVEQTGYTGLVTDAIAGDYSDKSGLVSNATYYINAGIRWLNRRWPNTGTERRYDTSLAEGLNYIDIPNSDYIRRLEITDSSRARTILRQVTLQWLQQYYKKPLDEVDAGTPLYWAVNPEPMDVERALYPNLDNSDNIVDVSGGIVYDDLVEGQILILNATKWTYDATEDTLTNTGTAFFDQLAMFIEPTKHAVVTVDWTYDPAQTERQEITAHFIASDGTLEVVIGNSHFVETDGITQYVLESDTPFNMVWFGPEQHPGDSTGVLSYWSVKSIGTHGDVIIMPPAIEDYDVRAFGDFSTPTLTYDTESNWWTIEHPEIVVNAARAIYERQGHRNVSGATAFEEYCEGELARIYSEYRFSLYSGMSPEDLALNG